MPEPRRRGDPVRLGPMLEAALAYARRGWPVLPCEPRGKRPLGRLVAHGLTEATTDVAMIERWWRAEPEANIGLRTGVAFDVLDVDKDGWGPLARLVEEHGCLPLGPVVLTPGGGAHYLYQVSGHGNRAKFISGCDWRGRDGYIVGAGSVHPNGGLYEWAIPPDEAELVPAPAWLVDRLTRQLAAPAQLGRSVDASAYGRHALEAECGRLALAPEGQRNDTLNAAAFALGQLVAGSVLDVREVVDALLTAAGRCGLSEVEARRTIASGLQSGARSPRRVK
jgi:hypothetical protein